MAEISFRSVLYAEAKDILGLVKSGTVEPLMVTQLETNGRTRSVAELVMAREQFNNQPKYPGRNHGTVENQRRES